MHTYQLQKDLPGNGDLTTWRGPLDGEFAEVLEATREWVRNDLHQLNQAIELGGADPGMLAAAAGPLVSSLNNTIPENIDKWSARAALQAVSMIVSSLERHFQSLGHVPGVGKDMLPYADELLGALGVLARQTPRDNTFTYWTWNRGRHPFRFTGLEYEDVFREAVNATYDLHAASAAALRPICGGDVHPLSSDAENAYQLTAANTAQLCNVYRALTDESNGEWRMPQSFFANRYRQYLSTFPIGNTTYSGVNAANVAPQMSLDYALGFTESWYDAVVERSFPYQTEEDRVILEQDVTLRSVTDRIFDALGYLPTSTDPAEKRWVILQVAVQSKSALRALYAYSLAVHEARRLTGIHFQLIHAFLIKPAKQDVQHSVQTERGTGGRTHEDTRRIMEMRQRHGLVSILATSIDGFRLARSA